MNEQSEKINEDPIKTEQKPRIKKPTPKKKVTLPEEEKNEDNNMFNTNQTNFNPRPYTSACSPSNGFRPYHRRRNFKETYGYEPFSEIKTNKERYQNEISDLKKNKLTEGEFNYTHSNFYYPKKRYNGFTSYAVPRTDKASDVRTFSNPFKVYSGRINRSLSSFNQESEYEKMEKQNDDIKQNLMNQTSQGFRKKYKLPDVLKIANTRQRIRNVSLGHSKEMGERYNPYCHMLNTGDRIGRNFVGALFQH